MSIMQALNEWSQRRYRPLKVRYVRNVSYGVEVSGDPLAPPKGLCSNWRRTWSWTVVAVHMNEPDQLLRYYPGYSYDGGKTFRQTVWPVTSHRFAFQVGPRPVMFSAFGPAGQLLEVNVRLIASGLTYTEVLRKCGGAENIAFV